MCAAGGTATDTEYSAAKVDESLMKELVGCIVAWQITGLMIPLV